MDVNQITRGMKLEIDGQPYEIVEYQHVKPGKGQAFARIKLKNLRTGNVVEKTYKVGEKLNLADFEEKTMEYIYTDGEFYYFMDSRTYEQVGVPASSVGERARFLKENTEVVVQFFKGEAISVKLPKSIVLKVTETEPGFKGDTVSNVTKPATLETGAVIQVPMFINPGDYVRVNPETGEYVERVNIK